MKFRKKPVVIDAVEWTGFNHEEIEEFAATSKNKIEFDGGIIRIETLEGEMIASRFDWLIRGVEGELYPCKPGIFEKTYEYCGENCNDETRVD